MPLLVVPLALGQEGLLTLEEWDRLRSCDVVLFERPDHPLRDRLVDAGVRAAPFDDEPDARRSGWGLVADPDSPRVLDLAKAGADVSAGPGRPPDALTAAHGAAVVRRVAAAAADVALVMARLRSEDGCPWDREQTHGSLQVHLVEEAYEVVDAIDRGLVGDELADELGDVLLQVAFHARMADQEGRFDLAGVAEHLVAKLIRRHPHVFGEAVVEEAAEVLANWESLKRAEPGRADPFQDIPKHLPALLAASKTQRRAASLGFGGRPDEARSEVAAALEAPPGEDSLGRALFWLVAVARAAGVDPESALRRATAAFIASMR